MSRHVIPTFLMLYVALCACRDQVICPAYQSMYILDDSIRRAKYSYFGQDSTPKLPLFASRRTKYGIAKRKSNFRRNYEMMTAPKVNVFAPAAPQDTTHFKDEGTFIASDFAAQDSLAADSLSHGVLLAQKPSKPKYKYRYGQDAAYNQEQVYYNKYFGELFIDRRPDPPTVEEATADTTKHKKKKFRLFPKRKKNKEEEATEQDDESQP